MSKIVLDAQLESRLNGLNEQIEVCDKQGKAVGQFLPQELYVKLLYAWAAREFADQTERQAAVDEIKRGGGMTTQEAIAYLQNLAS